MAGHREQRILVVHPFFGRGGGAEVVAAHIMNWLITKKGESLTLLMCATGNDLAGLQLINHLRSNDLLRIERISLPAWLGHMPGAFQAKVAFLHRRARAMACEYDLCISTYNETNFGKPGFQYVHHPVFLPRRVMEQYQMVVPNGLLDKAPLVEGAYRSFVRRYARVDPNTIGRNITAVNSSFIQSVMAKEYNVEATVIPPSLREREVRNLAPWESRTLNFISVGRFAADKKLLELVDLYAALHDVWPEAGFAIVGRKTDEEYFRSVVDRARGRALPLATLTDVSEEELHRLLETSRIYIGPKPYEHFGIATVDAINAGCLPIVHDSGGQCEIVNFPELRYRTGTELVARVSAVIQNPSRGTQLLKELQKGIASLTREDFFAGLESVIGPFLGKDHLRKGVAG